MCLKAYKKFRCCRWALGVSDGYLMRAFTQGICFKVKHLDNLAVNGKTYDLWGIILNELI